MGTSAVEETAFLLACNGLEVVGGKRTVGMAAAP